MTDQIADIFDRSLDQVLRGESIEASVRRHPETAAEVEPLLETALAGREALRVTISDESRAAARERLMSQAAVLLNERSAGSGFWQMHNRATKSLAVAGALLALTGGTAVAATAAGPDSFLYPMKQDLEDVREALATQNLDRAAVEVGRAGKRLDEIQGMVDKGEPQYVPSLLNAYDDHMNQAQTLVAEAAAQGKDTSHVVAMMDATRQRHDAILAALAPKVPDDMRNATTPEEARGGGAQGGGAPGGHEGGQGAPAESGESGGHDYNGGHDSGSAGDGSHGYGNEGRSDNNNSSETPDKNQPAPKPDALQPSEPAHGQDGAGPMEHGGSGPQENGLPGRQR